MVNRSHRVAIHNINKILYVFLSSLKKTILYEIKKRGTVNPLPCEKALRKPLEIDVEIAAPRICAENHHAKSCLCV